MSVQYTSFFAPPGDLDGHRGGFYLCVVNQVSCRTPGRHVGYPAVPHRVQRGAFFPSTGGVTFPVFTEVAVQSLSFCRRGESKLFPPAPSGRYFLFGPSGASHMFVPRFLGRYCEVRLLRRLLRRSRTRLRKVLNFRRPLSPFRSSQINQGYLRPVGSGRLHFWAYETKRRPSGL